MLFRFLKGLGKAEKAEHEAVGHACHHGDNVRPAGWAVHVSDVRGDVSTQ